jgi:hypothetical protein
MEQGVLPRKEVVLEALASLTDRRMLERLKVWP